MAYRFGKVHLWVIFTFLVFFWSKIALALDAPNLISPPDNSFTDKPKLIWEYSGECSKEGSCFRIEIDNSADFFSTEKTTYTKSLSYSPSGLGQGSYYWRVKAKDISDKWSDWSRVFKFNVGVQNNTASSPTSSPSQAPISTNTSNDENVFSIKDAPSEINSDQEIEINVLIKLTDKLNTGFYLKGAFKKSDSSNYFGETYSGQEWSKNSSSYSKQLSIATNSEGKWEGKIKVKPDSEDSGFKGTGDYVFKVGRYTDSGNGPVWSNELSLKINEVEMPEPSPSEEAEEEIEESEDQESSIPAKLAYAPPSRDYEFKIASVAGEATKSDNITLEERTKVLEEKKINWLLIILGMGVLIGGVGYGVYQIKLKK